MILNMLTSVLGVNRPVGTDRKLMVELNGTALSVPLEDAAARFEDDKSYASMKFVKIPTTLLKTNNVVKVSFPDGKTGGVGSVVIRAGIKGLQTDTKGSFFKPEIKLSLIHLIPALL